MMFKKVTFRVFVGFVALCLFVWVVIGAHDSNKRNKRIAEIKQELNMTAEQMIENENRPLPDSIYMLPSLEKITTQKIEFGYDEEGHKLAEENALKINKRDGIYYWDSNDGKLMKVVTEIKKRPHEFFSRRISTFTAEDGSGSVVIWHDLYMFKGNCHSENLHPAVYLRIKLRA